MSQYRQGTAAVTRGSPTVTGVSTAWIQNVIAGNWFEIQGEGVWYDVAAVIDDATLVLKTPYAGATNAKVPYVIQRDFTKSSGYPLSSYGDIDTATLLGYALMAIDLQLSQVQPRMTGFIDGNVTAAGTMSFKGVQDGDMAVEGEVTMRGVTDGDVEIEGELTLSGANLIVEAGSLASMSAILKIATANSTGTVPYAGIKIERGGTDAYWVWDEVHDRFVAVTSVDELNSTALTDIQARTIYGTVANPSDIRLKQVLGPIRDPLDKLAKLDAVRFLWNSRGYEIGRTGPDIGLIAQQVENVVPEAVVTQHTGERLKYVQYEKLVPVLVQAINELNARVKTLEGVA